VLNSFFVGRSRADARGKPSSQACPGKASKLRLVLIASGFCSCPRFIQLPLMHLLNYQGILGSRKIGMANVIFERPLLFGGEWQVDKFQSINLFAGCEAMIDKADEQLML